MHFDAVFLRQRYPRHQGLIWCFWRALGQSDYSSTSMAPALAHEGKTTYHPNVGEWTWTRHALRYIRCASFARRTTIGSALRRRKTDAKRDMYATRERLERLQLLEIEFNLRKRLRTASDATFADRGYVPVDMCGGGSQPLSLAQTNPPTRPHHKRPLWDKSLL